MARFSALFLLLLATLGISLAAPPPKSSGLPKIGVVSAIGDRLYLRKVGVTVFGNEAEEMAIDSWRLDDLMIAKVRAALAGRFDVRPVTYQRAPFATLAERNEIFAKEHRPELVRTGVLPQGLDGYLVITKTRSKYGQTNQTLLGLGLVEGGLSCLASKSMPTRITFSAWSTVTRGRSVRKPRLSCRRGLSPRWEASAARSTSRCGRLLLTLPRTSGSKELSSN